MRPRIAIMAERRNPLILRDLAAIAELSTNRHEPSQLYAAVDALVQRVIGHKLFTIMRFHEATMEVERVHSSNTGAYPVGGRKPKRGTEWGRVVLDRGEVFIARDADEVRRTFDDYALIFSLGVASIMNVPIGFCGKRLGTMNISNEAHWFREEDAEAGRLIASVLAPSFLAG
jgi:GAF domain-containing protein